MRKTRLIVSMCSAGLLLAGADVVCGQSFPNRPVRILAAEPGGSTDISARMIAQGISGPLGQPVIVENRPSTILGERVARATPDGYTVALAGSVLWVTPLVKKMSFDPVRDFAWVTWVSRQPLIFLVHPSVPAKSVKELIALAKAKPKGLNYASSGDPGATSFLGPELFKSMAGVDIVNIPYKGTGPGLNALLAGEVQFAVNNPILAVPHVKSGKLRALAITSAEPSVLLPDLPTVAASGVPGYECISIIGILAPAGTPATIVNLLNQEIVRFLTTAEVKEKFFNTGAEVVASSPVQFAAKIKSEVTKWGKVIKDAGIKAE